jgi:hypothetical protein
MADGAEHFRVTVQRKAAFGEQNFQWFRYSG